MAGIGFTLRRMLGEGGFAGPLRAVTYAAIIAAGPWIVSSLTLASLSSYGALAAASGDYRVFLALVSYAFASSLIGVGVVNQVASRYLADRLFENQPEYFSPAFAGLLAPLLGIQCLLAVVFLSFVPLPIHVKVAALILQLAVNGTWLAMVFLSAAKDYRTIVLSFAAGGVLSVACGIEGGRLLGLFGELAGFTCGYLLTFGILLARVKAEFGLPRRAPTGLAFSFVRFWPLAVAGLAYNLGIWVDKIMCWYHPATGEQVLGALYVAPTYDNAMFLSYLTIMPAMGMFLLRIETDFYDTYRAYFASIAAHAGLAEIHLAKAEMVVTLQRNLLLLLKVQAPITFGAILFAPEIFKGLGLDWASIFVFRFGALGAMLHAAHLMVMILLMYLDFRTDAMWLAIVFVLSNALFTLLVFPLGPAYLGMGYAFSCGLTLIFGVHLLARAVDDLEYHVFMRQPLT